jgi:hypothetical protein
MFAWASTLSTKADNNLLNWTELLNVSENVKAVVCYWSYLVACGVVSPPVSFRGPVHSCCPLPVASLRFTLNRQQTSQRVGDTWPRCDGWVQFRPSHLQNDQKRVHVHVVRQWLHNGYFSTISHSSPATRDKIITIDRLHIPTWIRIRIHPFDSGFQSWWLKSLFNPLAMLSYDRI